MFKTSYVYFDIASVFKLIQVLGLSKPHIGDAAQCHEAGTAPSAWEYNWEI
jgi:hypothetical protein